MMIFSCTSPYFYALFACPALIGAKALDLFDEFSKSIKLLWNKSDFIIVKF